MFSNLKNYNIILASQSPRRQFLLKELGINFTAESADVEEVFPENLKREEIALYLCELKAQAFEKSLKENDLVITADTIVWIEDQVLNKPKDHKHAVSMLQLLSGKMHEVVTAVCIMGKKKKKTFYAVTKVYFKHLSQKEIEYYIENFSPYDKAGAYGAQEWIGYIAVEKIEGSYFNVMGLPVKELYEELLKF